MSTCECAVLIECPSRVNINSYLIWFGSLTTGNNNNTQHSNKLYDFAKSMLG